MISPYSICLMILIKQYTENRTWSGLLAFLNREITDTSHHLGKSLPQIVKALLNELGKELASIVVANLGDVLSGFESPDDIFDFVSGMSSIVARGDKATTGEDRKGGVSTVESGSVFGLFVRKLMLEFNIAPFEATARLFDKVQVYMRAGRGGVEEAQEMGESTANTNSFLHHRVHQMDPSSKSAGTVQAPQFNQDEEEKGTAEAGAASSTAGGHTFDATEKLIADILKTKSSRLVPQVHFLRYLNCVRHREFSLALDSLHRYFDYCAFQDAGIAGRTGAGLHRTQQYAVLNLASLHAHFGHTEEAIRAIHETVRISQQRGDHACLMHALALLARLASEQGSGDAESARELLERCVTSQVQALSRAVRERDEWFEQNPEGDGTLAPPLPPDPVPVVESQNLLALAGYHLQRARHGAPYRISPLKVWDALLASTEVNIAHDGLGFMCQEQHALRASAWTQYGCRALASQHRAMASKAAEGAEGAPLVPLVQYILEFET